MVQTMSENLILAGVDYSYSCPAIAVMPYSKEFNLKNIKILVIYQNNIKINNTNLVKIDFKNYSCNIDKFIFIANNTLQIIKYFNSNKVYVALEDYSFGSRNGRNFTIGENASLIKERLFLEKYHLRLYSPTLIKRFVKEQNEELAAKNSDGKLKKDGTVRIGALNKKAMHEIFCWKFGVDLVDYFEVPFKKYQSPLSDIVDALWILYLHWCEWKIRNNNIECLTDQEIKFIKEGVNGEGFHKRPFEF